MLVNRIFFISSFAEALTKRVSEGQLSPYSVVKYGNFPLRLTTRQKCSLLPLLFKLELGLPGGASGKTHLPTQKTWDKGLSPGLGRSHREGHSNTFQYSCLENPMDRGIWQATQSIGLTSGKRQNYRGRREISGWQGLEGVEARRADHKVTEGNSSG